jgi:hypothetical protein
MVLVSISCLLIGMALARFFRVFVLAPAILLVCILVIPIAVAHGYSAGRIVLECVLVATGMPLAYLAGALIPRSLRAVPKYTANIRAADISESASRTEAAFPK